MDDLRMMQALPLSVKVRMTETRIRQWVDYYGESGVYISFSGGKDSIVTAKYFKDAGYNVYLYFLGLTFFFSG